MILLHTKPFRQGLLLLFFCLLIAPSQAQPPSLQALKSYPFPTELTASAQSNKIAWAFDEGGRRNVYVAEEPSFQPRKLTAYNEDDGQELTSLTVSANGKWVIYVRGGDHGSNWGDDQPVNVTHSPVM